ncbi:KpsF/GutQ family sugar-phosphate isomerase [Helicobacter sp. 11S02629-2]|uniref:KpsF/GutQ family sugar-phosphate isomerase n=1 Tax=Helicobacter sp. 11S02629-2 TaxID=1476195 RepID=UPI000BA51869|nr:KpsF/GutQ family sugar-phosphate isomerase [Helicobacter sp. 11S02629-2]PAF43251.1 hypothetical protein BKH40_07040 [Helicobacter sp. 11S02629-2]
MQANIDKDFLSLINKEAASLLDYVKHADLKDLSAIVTLLLNTEGKVVFCGVGKSALIAKKASATMSSTGTPSVFMHATEGMHGDLGMLSPKDSLIAISYSGASKELLEVLPHVRRLGVKIVAITKDRDSKMIYDYILPLGNLEEACPLGIAPTTSTTLTLAITDALNASLMIQKDFRAKDFASFHPGGSLGLALFVKVKDLMQTTSLPIITEDTSLKDAVLVMSECKLGSCLIVDSKGGLKAVLSDGDLRRAMTREDFNLNSPALLFANVNPKTIDDKNMLAIDALKILEFNKIQLLVVIDKDSKVDGILHIHTLVSAGFMPKRK